MPSWQSHLIKAVFRMHRIFHPPSGLLDIEKMRDEIETLAAFFKTKIELVSKPIEINNIPAEWIIPTNVSKDRVILYLHGGSYNSGSINSHRSLVAKIANSALSRGLILDYRLAPESIFPAAVEDAIMAYKWLLDNQFFPRQIVVAGDSAGGGLVLSLLISLRDNNIPLPAAAVCLSPWTDLSCSGESWEINAKKDLMLNRDRLLGSAQLYLGESNPETPLASPLFGDLRNLPPVLIQVGSDECVLSDSTRLAEKADTLDVTLEVWEGMQHEWHFAANILPEGRQAIDQIGQFIRSHISVV